MNTFIVTNGMRFRTSLAMAALALFYASIPLAAQGVDEDGYITSSSWLVLGPFCVSFECSQEDGDGDMVLNYIAPAHIACEYPQEGYEIDYDPDEAASISYCGSELVPQWRRFVDLADDRYQDLDSDIGDQTYVMSWLATYIEYSGEDEAEIELCLGSDDGAQVWIDQVMRHNHNGCRGWEECQDHIDARIAPGIHRIAVGVWEHTGDWGFSLALRAGGEPITSDSPGWTFLGIDNRGDPGPEMCVPPPCVPRRVTDVECSQSADGTVSVTWENPGDGCMDDQEILITVNGEETEQLPAESDSFQFDSEEAPTGSRVCVINASGRAACCTVPQPGPARIDHAPGQGDFRIRASMTEDGLTLYYDVWCETTNQGFICVATRENRFDVFENGMPLPDPVDHPLSWESMPCISPDGLTLYFSATQARGGAGRRDIWFARKEDPEAAAPFESVERIDDSGVNTSVNEKMGCVWRDESGGDWLFFSRAGQLMKARFNSPGDPAAGFSDELLLGEINLPGVSSIAPSLSPTGAFFLWSDWPPEFVDGSDPRPEGNGRSDIWLAAHDPESGSFADITCLLAPRFNSASYDISPWIAYDGRSFLFASDDGHPFRTEFVEIPIEGPLREFFGVPGPSGGFVRGDANVDGATDIADPIFVLEYLFAGGDTPPCLDSADANDDGRIDIADAIRLLGYLFGGAGDLPEPFGECGIDTTPSELGCEDYPPCE